MKKICFITTIPLTVKAFLQKQISLLQEEGFDITVICADAKELSTVLDPKVTLISLPFKRGADLPGILPNIYRLYRIFKREQFDIINYLTPNASFYSCIAGRMARGKNLIYSQCGLRYIALSEPAYSIFRFLEKITCRLSDEIQPVSASMMEFCFQQHFYSPKKAKLIGHGSSCGVDLDRFNIEKKEQWRQQIRQENQISSETFVIGFVGRITADKGINELLTACKSILNSQVLLWLVGPIDDLSSIQPDLMAWMKSCPYVKHTDFVNDIERYYAAFDLFVLPSYREGFGNVSIEAQSMNVPCLVTDILGLKDTIIPKTTGELVKVKSSEDLNRLLKKMLENRPLLQKYGANGRSFVQDHFEETNLMQQFVQDKKSKL